MKRCILGKIDCPHLNLHRDNGYWYFEFDALDTVGVYETHSVYTPRLCDMSVEAWVAEGREFVEKMESELPVHRTEGPIRIRIGKI